jgi:AmmeMemoRadiSam system protein A
MLQKRAGVFVSIHENGELRGCIGTTRASEKNIAQEIIRNAIEAASQDPRFPAIEPKELPYLDISVDVLSPYETIASVEDLDVKKYGVIVENGGRRGSCSQFGWGGNRRRADCDCQAQSGHRRRRKSDSLSL